MELSIAQAAALRELRAFAVAHSPFCQRFHPGFEHTPLTDLPIFTKQELVRVSSWTLRIRPQAR